jgi:hypothetical protein
MPPATELLRLSDSISLWQAYDPTVKADLFSSAIQAVAGVFLIDQSRLPKRVSRN